MSNTTIQYTGKVTVKVKNKPLSVRRNSGTNQLFHVLSQLIGGNHINDLYKILPKYMMIVDKEYEEDSYTDYEGHKLLLTEMPFVQTKTEESSCIFECYLTTANINKSLVQESLSQTTLLLLNGNKDKVLAHTEFDFASVSSIVSAAANNGQATISWELVFSNPEKV